MTLGMNNFLYRSIIDFVLTRVSKFDLLGKSNKCIQYNKEFQQLTGAKYSGVPHNVQVLSITLFAKPKSVIFTWPFVSSKMFSGFCMHNIIPIWVKMEHVSKRETQYTISFDMVTHTQHSCMITIKESSVVIIILSTYQITIHNMLTVQVLYHENDLCRIKLCNLTYCHSFQSIDHTNEQKYKSSKVNDIYHGSHTHTHTHTRSINIYIDNPLIHTSFGNFPTFLKWENNSPPHTYSITMYR